MKATIIRSDGSEHEINSVKNVRDISLVLHAAFDGLEYEKLKTDDGQEITVVYNERANVTNHAATDALPALAELAGGRLCGDVLVMDSSDFQRLES